MSSPPVPYPLLSPDQPDDVAAYLSARGVLAADEAVVQVARAGEGNMNCTMRVTTTRRSLIVKQARPWVEKYPQIPAPDERALMEAAFYQAVQPHPSVAGRMPTLLGMDDEHRVLLIDDLGAVADFTGLYAGTATDLPALPALVDWLSALHAATFPAPVQAQLTNRAMRALNHEHLFDFPLRAANGLDLEAITPGLQAEASRLQAQAAYVDAVTALGARYLTDGPTLLHGDFFPGSWVQAGEAVYIIDPEFGFFGPAEYDVGILLAHLMLAGLPDTLHAQVWQRYQPTGPFDAALARQFAGMEVMRRLIGVAQLPVPSDLAYKQALLQRSEELVLGA